MSDGEAEKRGVDIIIRKVQQRMPEVQVRQWRKTQPADDDGLWWFSLPGVVKQDIQIESPFGMCPFVVETNEQSSQKALIVRTADEAVAMIEAYLTSVKDGLPVLLSGELRWKEAANS